MQVCNHPALSYPHLFGLDTQHLVATCGKLLALDRMLVKLHASGHRVLLFSTMTRLLDLLQVAVFPQHFSGSMTCNLQDPGKIQEQRITTFGAPRAALLYHDLLQVTVDGQVAYTQMGNAACRCHTNPLGTSPHSHPPCCFRGLASVLLPAAYQPPRLCRPHACRLLLMLKESAHPILQTLHPNLASVPSVPRSLLVLPAAVLP